MKISVLIPTCNRTANLRRCLSAIERQQRPADEVVIVYRPEDEETRRFLDSSHLASLHPVPVETPGVISAWNRGLDAVTGDIVAITDDDTAPRPDWLRRIEQHFAADSRLGGAGGRDWVHQGDQVLAGSARTVGRIQWFGRIVGNHHLGIGRPRQVDILKGANMSFRMRALSGLRFDRNLRGTGAQVCSELAFSLGLRRSGWRLVYDPLIAVDHYPAPRLPGDERNAVRPEVVRELAFNHYWSILNWMHPGPRRTLALLWQRLVGTAIQPGALRALAVSLRGGPSIVSRWKYAREARSEASRLRRALRASPSQGSSATAGREL